MDSTGARLRAARGKLGLTQKEAGRTFGGRQQDISDWELERREAPAWYLDQLGGADPQG